MPKPGRWTYAGRTREFNQATEAMGLRPLRPDRKDEIYIHGNSVTRVGQRLLALVAAIWRDWATGVIGLRSLTAYDQ